MKASPSITEKVLDVKRLEEGRAESQSCRPASITVPLAPVQPKGTHASVGLSERTQMPP